MKHPLSKNTPAIRDPFIRVGTINKAVAKAAKIQAADIYINRNYRAHIRNRHAAEYEQAGLDVVTYARTICQNFNQIRATGKAVDEIKEAVLLVVHKEKLHDVAVIELNYSQEYHFWEIKTAEPRRNSAINKLALKWEEAKHPSDGNG
jgi:hypothetical protein